MLILSVIFSHNVEGEYLLHGYYIKLLFAKSIVLKEFL